MRQTNKQTIETGDSALWLRTFIHMAGTKPSGCRQGQVFIVLDKWRETCETLQHNRFQLCRDNSTLPVCPRVSTRLCHRFGTIPKKMSIDTALVNSRASGLLHFMLTPISGSPILEPTWLGKAFARVVTVSSLLLAPSSPPPDVNVNSQHSPNRNTSSVTSISLQPTPSPLLLGPCVKGQCSPNRKFLWISNHLYFPDECRDPSQLILPQPHLAQVSIPLSKTYRSLQHHN